MKKLTTTIGVFGPYAFVEILADRYHCDGADLPFTVVGEGGIVEDWEGALPTPQPLPPIVPTSVTMRQARLALLEHSLLGNVDAAIQTLPSPQKEKAQIEWEFSSIVVRDREFVQLLGTALGLSSAQLDDLFIEASAL